RGDAFAARSASRTSLAGGRPLSGAQAPVKATRQLVSASAGSLWRGAPATPEPGKPGPPPPRPPGKGRGAGGEGGARPAGGGPGEVGGGLGPAVPVGVGLAPAEGQVGVAGVLADQPAEVEGGREPVLLPFAVRGLAPAPGAAPVGRLGRGLPGDPQAHRPVV